MICLKLLRLTKQQAKLNDWNEIISKLGRFPFEQFTGKAKTQTTRNVKVSCSNCDFKFNTSRKQIKEIQIFDCLTGCGGTLEHDQDLSE